MLKTKSYHFPIIPDYMPQFLLQYVSQMTTPFPFPPVSEHSLSYNVPKYTNLLLYRGLILLQTLGKCRPAVYS